MAVLYPFSITEQRQRVVATSRGISIAISRRLVLKDAARRGGYGWQQRETLVLIRRVSQYVADQLRVAAARKQLALYVVE